LIASKGHPAAIALAVTHGLSNGLGTFPLRFPTIFAVDNNVGSESQQWDEK
jgi:hypothetical protein